MAKVDISVDGTEVQVNLTSPVLEFDIDTPQLVLPVTGTGDGVPGAPGPPGPQGPQGPPGAEPQEQILSGFATVPPPGGSGVLTLNADPYWAGVGAWGYVNDPAGNYLGIFKITSVDHVGWTIGFTNWTPAS